MATLIEPNGTETSLVLDRGTRPWLKQLQDAVGGSIEHLALADGRSLIINEDGKGMKLDRNNKATLLAREAGIVPWDWIVGAAVVCDAAELDTKEEEE